MTSSARPRAARISRHVSRIRPSSFDKAPYLAALELRFPLSWQAFGSIAAQEALSLSHREALSLATGAPEQVFLPRMIVRLRTLATPATYALSADHREIREMRVIDGGAVTEFGINPRNQAMPDRRPRIALRSIRATCCRLRAELSSDARGFLVARMKRNVTRECLMDCPGLRSRSSRATCCLRTLSGHAPPTHIRSPGNWLACLTQPANRASSSSSSSWMWK